MRRGIRLVAGIVASIQVGIVSIGLVATAAVLDGCGSKVVIMQPTQAQWSEIQQKELMKD